MAKRRKSNQLDLLDWAENRPSSVIDRVDFFKMQKLRACLWRKRVELGVYAAPCPGDVVEIRRQA